MKSLWVVEAGGRKCCTRSVTSCAAADGAAGRPPTAAAARQSENRARRRVLMISEIARPYLFLPHYTPAAAEVRGRALHGRRPSQRARRGGDMNGILARDGRHE